MAHILALSSWVAHGHVGLSAAAPVLQRLGHKVSQLPTVLLSNHPGWSHVSGAQVPPQQLSDMIDALEKNGWLAQTDAILTGYLPSAEHVRLASELIVRTKAASSNLHVIVDPVLGDEPKGLYIAAEAATALRDELLPLADILTPNRFELAWLSEMVVEDMESVLLAARKLYAEHAIGNVCVTSAPAPTGMTGVAEFSLNRMTHWVQPRRDGVPNGVGDAFAAFLAAGLSVGNALGHLTALIDESLHADHLRIAETAPLWSTASSIAPSSTSAGLEVPDGL